MMIVIVIMVEMFGLSAFSLLRCVSSERKWCTLEWQRMIDKFGAVKFNLER